MKSIFTVLTICAVSVMLNFLAVSSYSIVSGAEGLSEQLVVPNVNEDSSATGTFLGPLANTDRTYQLLINESQLTNFLGRNITGISWRLPTSATGPWPAADVNFTAYDIYLSRSVAPANRSLTFANNVIGSQTQVRSGALFIPDSSYGIVGSPNPFGPVIIFNTPYFYSGGHLLVEIRHDGFTGTSRSVEASSTSTSGYGTLFSACWTGSYTGTSGAQGNFGTVRLTGELTGPTLMLNALIEGFYDDVSNAMVSDTATVVVRNSTSPYSIVDQDAAVLDTSGRGFFFFGSVANAVNYYFVVVHRNSISTWSGNTPSFSGNFLAYDFTTANSQAFGNNLKFKGTEWTDYSGDILRDGFVDLSDITAAFNDASIFAGGYIVTDVNGDTFADLSDITIVYNNAQNFVQEIAP